jgi:hypothetical protein
VSFPTVGLKILYLPTFALKLLIEFSFGINPLNFELNPICHLLALLKAHRILQVSRIRVKENNKKTATISHENCLLSHHFSPHVVYAH